MTCSEHKRELQMIRTIFDILPKDDLSRGVKQSGLDSRYVRVLNERLNGAKLKTIAVQLGVSPERVRQMERKSFRDISNGIARALGIRYRFAGELSCVICGAYGWKGMLQDKPICVMCKLTSVCRCIVFYQYKEVQ